jgi:hypothetical protein
MKSRIRSSRSTGGSPGRDDRDGRRFDDCSELGQALLDHESHDPIARTEGRYLLGVSAFWRGDLAMARHYLDGAIKAYDVSHRDENPGRQGGSCPLLQEFSVARANAGDRVAAPVGDPEVRSIGTEQFGDGPDRRRPEGRFVLRRPELVERRSPAAALQGSVDRARRNAAI